MEKKGAIVVFILIILASVTAATSEAPDLISKFQYSLRIVGAITILSAVFFYVSRATAELHNSLLKWKYWDFLKHTRKDDEPNLSSRKTRELNSYLENCRKMFYPRKRVVKALLHFGWSQETVSKMISKFYD